MALSKEEREQFLAERLEHIEAVAIFMKTQHWISADLGSM
jgi:hypothetical protein